MVTFTPTVSVIIPVYNGEKTIESCLDSLLALHYPRDAFEVVVVENGSTDRTIEIVAQYPVRLLSSQHRGPAAARNVGISQAIFDLVAFTDADCVAHPDWLTKLVQPYVDEGVGGVAGMINAFPNPNADVIERFSNHVPPLVNYVSGENEFFPHLYTANASYRKQPLVEIGCFNARMVTGEDVELSWRFQTQTTYQVRYAPDAIIYHRHRATRNSLARQYRQYGYGEILLDTIFAKFPGYPRSRSYQLRQITRQILVLPRYMISMIVRRVRRLFGKGDVDAVTYPGLWLLIESSNIRGKLDAFVSTRGMQDAQAALSQDPVKKIRMFY